MQKRFLPILMSAPRYSRGSLQVLNQLKLPHETEYVPVCGAEDAFQAIKTMMVSVIGEGHLRSVGFQET